MRFASFELLKAVSDDMATNDVRRRIGHKFRLEGLSYVVESIVRSRVCTMDDVVQI